MWYQIRALATKNHTWSRATMLTSYHRVAWNHTESTRAVAKKVNPCYTQVIWESFASGTRWGWLGMQCKPHDRWLHHTYPLLYSVRGDSYKERVRAVPPISTQPQLLEAWRSEVEARLKSAFACCTFHHAQSFWATLGLGSRNAKEFILLSLRKRFLYWTGKSSLHGLELRHGLLESWAIASFTLFTLSSPCLS